MVPDKDCGLLEGKGQEMRRSGEGKRLELTEGVTAISQRKRHSSAITESS